jgi:hypothetical protein
MHSESPKKLNEHTTLLMHSLAFSRAQHHSRPHHAYTNWKFIPNCNPSCRAPRKLPGASGTELIGNNVDVQCLKNAARGDDMSILGRRVKEHITVDELNLLILIRCHFRIETRSHLLLSSDSLLQLLHDTRQQRRMKKRFKHKSPRQVSPLSTPKKIDVLN